MTFLSAEVDSVVGMRKMKTASALLPASRMRSPEMTESKHTHVTHTATHTATNCNILQHTATHCNTLQHKMTESKHRHVPSWPSALMVCHS